MEAVPGSAVLVPSHVHKMIGDVHWWTGHPAMKSADPALSPHKCINSLMVYPSSNDRRDMASPSSWQWASCQIHKIAGCACECRDRFPPPLRVGDPDMHHGTCVTHEPWCIPGSLTCGFPGSRWRGKRSRCMRNPQFYLPDKRPMLRSHQWYIIFCEHYMWNINASRCCQLITVTVCYVCTFRLYMSYGPVS